MSSPDELSDLPPSAKLVYKVLEYEGDLTQSQLSDETMLTPRTVRHAIRKLQSADLVEEDIYSADARQKLYSLAVSSKTDPDTD